MKVRTRSSSGVKPWIGALGATLEDSRDGAVGHVDRQHPQGPLERRGREVAATEGVAPGQVPEGRVDDVERVVEDEPEPGRRVGEPGELAVHRVEHAHQVRQRQARNPGSRGEQRERHGRREPADAGDPVRMDAPARQRPHHHPDERRVDVAGQEVGGALVVRPEEETLDAVAGGGVWRPGRDRAPASAAASSGRNRSRPRRSSLAIPRSTRSSASRRTDRGSARGAMSSASLSDLPPGEARRRALRPRRSGRPRCRWRHTGGG